MDTAKEEASKENITFRFDKELLDRLRFEADENSTSVNAVAQAILTTHYKWTAASSKAGMIPIHRSLLAMFLDKLNDDEVADMAKLFGEVRVKDMMLILRNDYNIDSFLDLLETWMSVSSVTFSKNVVDGSFRYVIGHEIGTKWSTFFSLMLQTVFMNMGIQDVTLEVTDGTIMFSIPKIVLRAK